MQAGKEKFIGLEWLRFFLGVYLVMYHTLPFYESYTRLDGLVEVNELGFFATSCFFALSGFLLAHVYLDGNRLRERPTSIMAKRFANLYPIHLVGLASCIALVLITGTFDSHTDLHLAYRADDLLKRTAPEQLEYHLSDLELALNALLQLTLLHAWNPVFLAYNGPLWSISTLFFFYLVFPYFAPRLAAARHKVWLLLLTWIACLIPPVVVILNGDYGSTWIGLLHHFPLFRLPVFLAGILAYLLFREYEMAGSGLHGPIKLLAVVALGVGLSIAAELNWHGGNHWYVLLHNGLMLPMVLATVGLCAMIPSPANERHRRWARRLGGASLPMFALHTPIFIVFRRLEMLLNIDFQLCLNNAVACVAQAKAQPLFLGYYPFLLLFTIAFCVVFQEQFVSRARQWLLDGPLRRAVVPVTPPRPGAAPARAPERDACATR
ncbi:acyltransferase family protein [Stutzerimonas azotifigens]|uniref:acyltransferase family protein n=1 Tax=Stutzerimonas azotifigens TaxID=291995 RepID=UPI0003F7804E|nr:acyltransferase [Stutzerimonas azotifigens]